MSSSLEELLARASRDYSKACQFERGGVDPKEAADLRGNAGDWLHQARRHFEADAQWRNWIAEHFLAPEAEVLDCFRHADRLHEVLLNGLQKALEEAEKLNSELKRLQ